MSSCVRLRVGRKSSFFAEIPSAMHDRFERRIEQKLEAMAEGCGKRKQDPLKVAQQVGRLQGKNSRAAGLFQVDVEV